MKGITKPCDPDGLVEVLLRDCQTCGDTLDAWDPKHMKIGATEPCDCETPRPVHRRVNSQYGKITNREWHEKEAARTDCEIGENGGLIWLYRTKKLDWE